MSGTLRLDWSDIEGLPEIIDALGGGEYARLVGGCVRDRLLDVEVQDIDIATTHPPATAIALLEKAGLRAIPTGIDHGTVTALSAGRPFEITTLRRDVETDGRRAIVEYSDDWAEDAARRDFTINAFYSDAGNGDVFDYVGGLADIAGPHVRFIGDPAQRIAEDHLRILRYFRFLARFGSTDSDAAALAACHAARASLMTLSRERIASELLRLLAASNPSPALTQMAKIELFETFLPEVIPNPGIAMGALVRGEREAAVGPSPQRRLALLLPPDIKLLEKIAARLKFSNRFKHDLVDIARARLCGKGVHVLTYRFGREAAIDALLIRAAFSGLDATAEIALLGDWDTPRLPIKGGDLIRRGLPPGPIVSNVLREIESQWIEDGFPLGSMLDDIVTKKIAAAARSDQ